MTRRSRKSASSPAIRSLDRAIAQVTRALARGDLAAVRLVADRLSAEDAIRRKWRERSDASAQREIARVIGGAA